MLWAKKKKSLFFLSQAFGLWLFIVWVKKDEMMDRIKASIIEEMTSEKLLDVPLLFQGSSSFGPGFIPIFSWMFSWSSPSFSLV